MNHLKQIWPEIRWAVLILVLLAVAPYGLRLVDPTAATLDAGTLHLEILGAFRVFVRLVIVWGVLKVGFGTVHGFISPGSGGVSEFGRAWNDLRCWQKVTVTVAVVALVMWFVLSCFPAGL